MEHAFGTAAYALGVEEELLLVAPDPPHALQQRADELVERLASEHVKPDVYEAIVESASSICADAPEAAGQLERLRDELRAAGATLAGAGLHPAAAFGDVVHVNNAR